MDSVPRFGVATGVISRQEAAPRFQASPQDTSALGEEDPGASLETAGVLGPSTRLEYDSLGAIDVPAHMLWAAQTERCRRLFAIGAQRMPLPLIHAIAGIKRAAAEVNLALGLLDADKARAIGAAAGAVAAGRHDEQFPLTVWQTGSGTQSNMNVNEVIASLASLALGGGLGIARKVHPNDEVNLGQSSNDVFPSAIHLAVVSRSRGLCRSLDRLIGSLRRKAVVFAAAIKTGRTHLQDAMPVTVGQEFGAHAAQLDLARAALALALPPLHALAIGGTAVGTGVNTHPAFGLRVCQVLAERLGEPWVPAPNLFAAMAGKEALVGLHGVLKLLATSLHKIASDIRLMSSGPRAGFGELRLPENEPGSSIMPGKINPTQVEALTMVCVQVIGHDVAITMAASLGQFQLNTYQPLIAHDVLDSLGLLDDAMSSFAAHCIDGLEVNTAHLRDVLDGTLVLVTALAPHVGYDQAAKIAAFADSEGVTLREAASRVGGVNAADFDRWVDPQQMLGSG